MTSNWEFSVALSEVNTNQWAPWFICYYEFSLLSLIFVKGWGGESQEKNDSTFFCSNERKAAAGSLNAVGLVLWKCFSCATGLRESLFFSSQRHCNQIYGCSSALPQRDAVVWSSACSSWKRAEGEQLTRACRGYALEAVFFLKLNSTCEIPPAAEEAVSVGLQVDPGFARGGAYARAVSFWWKKSFRQADCALLKARLSQPSGGYSNCADGTSAVVLHMP